jgi:hypothetical protein
MKRELCWLLGVTACSVALLCVGCRTGNQSASGNEMNAGEASRNVGVNDAFAEDVAFLRRHVDTIVLESGEAKVAVVPAYQGRVMTSTTGARGSFGWLNKETIAEGILAGAEAEGKLQSHIHVFGGEERFWLGPEGGQFGVYFPPGAAFDFDSWKTPAPIDTEPT